MDWRKGFALVFISLTPVVGCGHSGGIDENGGHLDRTTRTYHCHADDCLLPQASSSQSISVASFNIQFLGHGKHRDDTALAALMAPYDLVIVQELVAPPYPGHFPNGAPYKPDKEAAEFFDAMVALGFDYWLSEEDTGTGDRLHVNSPATEWWVAFYKPAVLEAAPDLPNGFLAHDRSNHSDYERVPYAFSFRAGEARSDFVVVSVHLQPGDRNQDTARRQHELSSIWHWIDSNDNVERDFVVLGDMNFEDCEEISLIVSPQLYALSQGSDCLMTNTNVNGPRPYDNVLIPLSQKAELGQWPSLNIVNLITTVATAWVPSVSGQYPGNPYDHNRFRAVYSDHHPIAFALPIGVDDDGL